MREPIDPDLDPPGDRGASPMWMTLLVIALGGGLGALARYGIESARPAAPGGVPWATFGINVVGCLLIGVLMVTITEAFDAHPLTRPFLGVGVLGGFTTFSTYAVEVVQLADRSELPVAALYLVGTVVAALVAVIVGVMLARTVLEDRITGRGGRP